MVFPRVLATTRIMSDEDGVAFTRSIPMQSLSLRSSTFITLVRSHQLSMNRLIISINAAKEIEMHGA